MVNLPSTRMTPRATLALLILASCLAGCAQPGSYPASTEGYGSSVPPGTARSDSPWPNETTPDPYHYRCTGACLRSF